MDQLECQLITPEAASELSTSLLKPNNEWKDGKSTAGAHAAAVKNNLQLDRESRLSIEKSRSIVEAIEANPLLKSFTLPKLIHGVMFTLSQSSQGYGVHIDNTYMSTGRSDLSFTLFLSEPETYQGGELSIQGFQSEQKFKLAAGKILIYPSTSLHSVETITYGQRLVCVGWIQSYIKSNEDRNILFGLDAGAKGLMANHGRSDELDLVFQAYSNLLRRLGD